MINILAYFAMTMSVLAALVTPLLIGRQREPYSYSNFINAIGDALIIILLGGRVLGWF